MLPSVTLFFLPNRPRSFQIDVSMWGLRWGQGRWVCEAEGQKPSKKSPSELEAKENQLEIAERNKQMQ